MAYNGFKGVGPRGLGTSPLKQTNHKRLAEIKLTQERLNKKPAPKSNMRNVKSTIPKSALKPKGGAGALELVVGASLYRGAFNLAKGMKLAPFMDVQIKDD